MTEIEPPTLQSSQREVDQIAPEVRRAWTKSAVERQARAILGPFARVRHQAGRYTVWVEKGKTKIPLGSGVDPWECFWATFILPQKAREAQDAYAEEQEANALENPTQQSPGEPSPQS